VPGHRALANGRFAIFYITSFSSMYLSTKSYLFECFALPTVRWLRDKAWKARRRAEERREHRNKTQNTLLTRMSLLTAALTETAPLQPKDRIKSAKRKAIQGWRFLHLKPTFQKLVRQHDRWKALLTVEIGKAEKLQDKDNLKQSRRDDKRDIGRNNEILKHGIKGIKKIT